MSIFNSLGSNYSFRFVWQALWSTNAKRHTQELTSFLNQKYQGQTILLYKGREAIGLALKLLNFSDAAVVVNGYTCYVVYAAIKNVHYKLEMLDVLPEHLDFTPEQLESAIQRNPKIKVVIIQNTLGYPCDIEKILSICRRHQLILIEDLAHSVGATYLNGQEAGTVGDFVALSFSQDKMIDGVSGGALIIRHQQYQSASLPDLQAPSVFQQLRDRFYPLLTVVVRSTHRAGLGKVLLVVLKKLRLLSQPLGEQTPRAFHTLPAWYARLVSMQFQELAKNLEHRQRIAQVYKQYIPPSLLLSQTVQHISRSTHVRFPILVKDKQGLITYLKAHHIYVSDIWYDAPIAPRKYMALIDDVPQLPQAERMSELMLNLPTHRYVSVAAAKKIALHIHTWLESK